MARKPWTDPHPNLPRGGGIARQYGLSGEATAPPPKPALAPAPAPIAKAKAVAAIERVAAVKAAKPKKAPKRGRPKVTGERDWEKEGVSKRTWYRRQQKGKP